MKFNIYFRYLEKHISTELKEKNYENENTNGTIIPHPPIYMLSCIKDPLISNTRKMIQNDSQTDYYIQNGTIRNFVECKYLNI